MKREWLTVFMLLFLVFSATAEDAQLTDKSSEKIIGVDNFIFSSDSSDLLNSTLIDFQVEYDIAFAQKDFVGVAKSLHKISLVYFHLNKLNLASTYAWRSNNVAKKHGLNKEELNAYAILFKINEQQGNVKQAKQLKDKYYAKLSEIAISPEVSNYAVQKPQMASITPEDTQEDALPLSDMALTEPEKIQPNQNEASVNLPYWMIGGVVVTLFVIAGIALLFIRRTKQKVVIKSEQIPEKESESIKVSITKNTTNSLNQGNKSARNKRVTKPVAKPSKTSSLKIPKSSIYKENSSLVKSPAEPKDGAESVDTVLAAINMRSAERTPLWISAIEHHLKDVKVVSGVPITFVYAGKMSSVPENLQNACTKFIKEGIGMLVKDISVQNISVQLVVSSQSMVASMFAKPISTSRSQIQTKVADYLNDANDSLVSINDRLLDSGTYKVVLRSMGTEKIAGIKL